MTQPSMARPRRVLRWILRLMWRGAVCLALLYAFGAIFFNGPLHKHPPGNLILAGTWAVLVLLACWRLSGAARGRVTFALLALVLVPWSFIRPSNERNWQPPFRETGRVTIEGDSITFHAFRNFDCHLDGTEIERWEDRTVRLSNLRALDYFHVAFGGDWIAHPILSFDFGPDGHVCLSIETRRETHESFSTLGGLFKLFELQYLFGSEEDFIRVRTNLRNEPIYLYRLVLRPEMVHAILMNSISVQNELAEQPRWYNVISANCTTSLRAQTPSEKRRAFDWRMLVNGRLDELVHERGGIADGGLPFAELRPLALINEAALKAHDDPDFSARIRAGRPGFASEE